MAKKNVTIDQLAVMVQKGFHETAKKTDMDFRFGKVETRLDKIETKLEKIEKIILDDHRDRIEKLESKVLYLENMLNLPTKH